MSRSPGGVQDQAWAEKCPATKSSPKAAATRDLGLLGLDVGVDAEASPRSKRHVCFLVPDLEAARARIVADGIAIEEESVAEGLKRFFIRDPADNRIEIGQRQA